MEIFHRTFFPRIKRVWTEGSTSDGTIEIPLTRIPLPSYDSPSLSLSFLAWGVGGDPLRFDVPTAIIYDFCRWRKQSTVNWGRYVWSSVLSKWIELAAPANISLSTDRCSLSTIPMIIIYFAYPVYIDLRPTIISPKRTRKKNSYVQNYPPSNFSSSYRLAICKKKKYPLPVLSIVEKNGTIAKH